MVSVKHSSESNEQYTPLRVVEMCRKVLGQIDLDPATSELANQRVKAKQIFTIEDRLETFKRAWRGNVFVNPPGGQRLVLMGTGLGSNPAIFWAKLMYGWHVKQTVNAAIFLGFTMEVLQTTQQTLEYPMLRFPFCIPSRRLQFDIPRTEKIRQLEVRIQKDRGRGRPTSALEEKLVKLQASDELLVPGEDPPHGNVLVLVPPRAEHWSGVDKEDRRWTAWQGPYTNRFFDVFSELGYVRI